MTLANDEGMTGTLYCEQAPESDVVGADRAIGRGHGGGSAATGAGFSCLGLPKLVDGMCP
jgi:hypothetical protein